MLRRNFHISHKRKNKEVTTHGAEAEKRDERNNGTNNCAQYAAATPIHTAAYVVNDKRGLSPQSKADEKSNKRYY